ncbi:hypothetical protein EZH22_19505 [Xanthobacter dioxanivorans]|uniref:Uncharacterized protein n=1 Tax=Xanthobacter dioxanivorans TaxID=2528964 RepID=A0A974PL95_9HYPH|nr:hypothetical protein [Xanthobacter dioxanivorans]QRG05269.1 hypothetical protein EZH22_19505 [Xanthobacter dioxanivorans]
MLRPALALCTLLALAGPAAAQQKMTWHLQEGEETTALVFGVPDSDDGAIFFLCKPGTPGLTVQSMIGSKGIERGASTALVLTVGATKKSLVGKGVAGEEGEQVDVEAPAQMADLKAFAKAGGTLTIEVKGAKRAISLSGVGPLVAKFEAACKAKPAPKAEPGSEPKAGPKT